jgi:hypothetical protein
MSEFGPNEHLRPILHACVASLIMYDRDVVRNFNKTNRDGTHTQFIHAKLRQLFIQASVYDTHATSRLPDGASDDTKAIATLNYWGQIIREDFHNQMLTSSHSQTRAIVKLLLMLLIKLHTPTPS